MQYDIKTTYARTDKQILGLDSQRDAERDAQLCETPHVLSTLTYLVLGSKQHK